MSLVVRVGRVAVVLAALAGRAGADCTLTNVGLTALPDLGWGTYSNNHRYFVGGLYPNGANQPPAAHTAGSDSGLGDSTARRQRRARCEWRHCAAVSGVIEHHQEWASGNESFHGTALRSSRIHG
jgi:hypothetical protein